MTLSAEILIPKLAALSPSYQRTVLLPALEQNLGLKLSNRKAIRAALKVPVNSLRVFFGCFAFARAGGERAGYGNICIDLLSAEHQYKDGTQLLADFRRACQERRIGTNDKLTSDIVLHGFSRHFGTDKAVSWLFEVGSKIRQTGTIRPLYLDLLSIRGIGEKIAAFLCRDLVWIFDCEDRLLPAEKLLIQPIDTWVRSILVELWPEFKKVAARPSVDFLLASSICAAIEKMQQSCIEFNQGSWYFGSHYVRNASNLAAQLDRLQSAEVDTAYAIGRDTEKRSRTTERQGPYES
jgi:hypothetical protein